MKWTRYNKDWHGDSPKYGPVKLVYSSKSKTWYLMTRPWFGEGMLIKHGDKKTLQHDAEN